MTKFPVTSTLTNQTANSQILPQPDLFIAFDAVLDYKLFTHAFLKHSLSLWLPVPLSLGSPPVACSMVLLS